MNIKITHKWLLDFIETDATPLEIQKYLSLCGPSVESVEETAGGDFVYDIEITSNRIDSASVYGIALECQAILPMFGKKAVLKNDPLQTYRLGKTVDANNDLLKVSFGSPDLCSRFTVAVMDNVSTKPSPDFIRERLSAVGIKVINNVVDISNYLMVTLGQPTHVFDYDKIAGHEMKMRESQKGEKITTLDGREITLHGGDIVIEDGTGELIDLCGIMGGLNSSFTEATRRVIFFVQTYNKSRIRRTSMTTGQRTIAATYFEKGLDEERVAPTLVYGVRLLEQYADAKQINSTIDIRTKKYVHRTILFTQADIDGKIGVHIEPVKVEHILRSLGFPLARKDNTYEVTVPSFRQYDVEIMEDIIEEIARIYGYHNLPNNLPPSTYVPQPPEFERLFTYQNRIKLFLKHLGLHEVLNYSMISEEMIRNFGLKPDGHLALANVLSEEIKFMRITLLPSLVKDIKINEGRRESLKLFELAKVYPPQDANLPGESYRLGVAVTTSFEDLKGIIEALVRELNQENYSFAAANKRWFTPLQADILVKGKPIGSLGQLRSSIKEANGIKSPCFLAELDFHDLIAGARTISTYRPLHPYAVVKLDVTYLSRPETSFAEIRSKAFSTSKMLTGIDVVSRFENNVTLRFYFSSPERNVTEEEAKSELSHIKTAAGI